MGLQTVANQFLSMEQLQYGVANSANQFLNMEPLEHAVANSCKSVSNHGTVGIWGCKQLQISFKPWNRWNMGLQTVANQFLNMEPL